MPRDILTLIEIRELIGILRELFAHHERIRSSEFLGSLIQYPKIPPFLSESIVFHLLESGELLGEPTPARKSDTGGDLEIAANDGSVTRIEIKATGKSAFQFFGDKDLNAQMLVWVHFDDVFSNPAQMGFRIYRLLQPRSYFPVSRKIRLADFLRIGGADVAVTIVNLNSLLR